ncbi:hypothetical protein T07_2924 [Trichinella nelsoni]|uniref:Uncharacterized protein n=1 Tax=Trichinella nelsoni TaxID=6336 RepID=A0A0V0RWJ5_9BILA|nr:hypothetical protein T07_2924 [Trichinella nelsoni]
MPLLWTTMLGKYTAGWLANFVKLQQSGLKAVPDFLGQAFKNSRLVSFSKMTLPNNAGKC